MKKFSFLLILTVSLFSAATLFAQIINKELLPAKKDLKTNVEGSYPTEVWEYEWTVEMWTVHQQKLINYTSFGLPEEITIIGDDGSNRTEYTYNQNHQTVGILIQKKENNIWINERRDLMEYDGNGRETQRLIEYWSNQEWALAEGMQYTYDSDQEDVTIKTTKIWSRGDNDWILSLRTTISTNGEGSIVNVKEGWEHDHWKLMGKTETEFGENESSVETYFSYVEEDWVATQRSSYNYDSYGNIIMHTSEVYTNDEWLLWSGSQYLLTYENDNLVERITKTTDYLNPGVWKNSYKEVFKSFASLSAHSWEMSKESVSHYPNPAWDFISVSFENLGDHHISLVIIGLTGEKVLQKDLYIPSDNFTRNIDTQEFASGNYILLCRDKSGKIISSSQFLKQNR